MIRESVKIISQTGHVRHGCVGIVDESGVFCTMTDDNSVRHYKFSGESDFIAKQSIQLEKCEMELQKANEKLAMKHSKAAAANTRASKYRRAAIEVAKLVPKSRRDKAHEILMEAGIKIDEDS